MFRNGGSEYAINGDTCRLLDIQELLSDSGIGREMHVIVGQGQLDSVLHADPRTAAASSRRRPASSSTASARRRRCASSTRCRPTSPACRTSPTSCAASSSRSAGRPRSPGGPPSSRPTCATPGCGCSPTTCVALRDGARGGDRRRGARCKERREAVEAELAAARGSARPSWRTRSRQLAPRLPRAQETWYRLSPLAERVRGTIALADAAGHATSPTSRRRSAGPRPRGHGARGRPDPRAGGASWRRGAGGGEHALDDTVDAPRPSWSAALAAEERAARRPRRARIADRREGLARLAGQVERRPHPRRGRQAEIDRLARRSRPRPGPGRAGRRREYARWRPRSPGWTRARSTSTSEHEQRGRRASPRPRPSVDALREEERRRRARARRRSRPAARRCALGLAPQGRHRRAARRRTPAHRAARPGRGAADRASPATRWRWPPRSARPRTPSPSPTSDAAVDALRLLRKTRTPGARRAAASARRVPASVRRRRPALPAGRAVRALDLVRGARGAAARRCARLLAGVVVVDDLDDAEPLGRRPSRA